MFTFILGSALAGAAGVMFAMRVPTTVSIGFVSGLKGFTAAVIGGIGSIPGAMAGGLILGVPSRIRRLHLDQVVGSLRVLGSDPLHDLPPTRPARSGGHPQGMTP